MGDSSKLREQVLEARSAGVGFAVIAEQFKLADADAARSLYREALDDTDPRFDVALEVRRVDRLLGIAWVKATKGDLAAMDRVIKLSERRERLVGWSRDLKHEMREAFDLTVENLRGVSPDRHAALIASGRVIADRIDAALCDDDRTEVTKSLYLIPHLINVLRELGASPSEEERIRALSDAAQESAGEGNGNGKPVSKLTQLRSAEQRRANRAG